MNARKNIFLNMAILLLSLSFACHKKAAPTKVAVDYSAKGYVKGTMTDQSGLDGCGFLINLDSGEKIEPNKMWDEFKKDGMKVWVKYNTPKTPLISICMSGKMVNIIDIKPQE